MANEFDVLNIQFRDQSAIIDFDLSAYKVYKPQSVLGAKGWSPRFLI